MDKYKRLVSNTMLFAISTFSSKLLSFVMAPLFSYWFETQEMNGIKELLNQCASLLIPLVSLGIANAVIRFGLEKGIRKSAIYMNGLVSIGMGFVLLLLLYPLLSRIALFRDYIALLYVSKAVGVVAKFGGTIGDYWPLLLIFVFTSCLRTLNCQFCRARQLNRLYAIDGILCTITTCGFYVLFLRVLNMGPTGYLLAIICADGLSALFLFAVTKTWRFLDFKRFDTKLLKKMLRYALPLVPASIFWWITNASDQFFVAAMLEDGTSWTAVLGASYKLPTILSIVSTIFTEAWQISAFTDGTDSQREQFFSRVFSAYQSLIFLAAAGIVLMAQPFMAIYRDDYFIGWKFIPLLTMATAFASFDNFLNSIYMVEKRSTLSFTTMAVGAGVNVALNFTLIPVWGVNGAALATFVSYFVVFLLRAVNTRGLIRVDFAPEKLCCNFGLLVLESALMMWQVKLWPVWCSLVVVLIAAINFRDLWSTVQQLLGRGKKKRA